MFRAFVAFGKICRVHVFERRELFKINALTSFSLWLFVLPSELLQQYGRKRTFPFLFFLFALGPLILLSFTLQSYLQLTKIGLQCERVPRERYSVMAGREWTWRHNFDMCSWPPLMNRKIRIYPGCICNLCKCQPLISNLKISPKKVARLVNGWKIEINQ